MRVAKLAINQGMEVSAEGDGGCSAEPVGWVISSLQKAAVSVLMDVAGVPPRTIAAKFRVLLRPVQPCSLWHHVSGVISAVHRFFPGILVCVCRENQ